MIGKRDSGAPAGLLLLRSRRSPPIGRVGQFNEILPNPFHDTRPIPNLRLPIKFGGRVPRVVFPIEKPTPVRRELCQNPHWLGESTGKMDDGGIGANHEIKIGDYGSRVGEVRELRAKMDELGELL